MYYECHITVDPVFDERLDQFKSICKNYNFKVAKLLMQKDKVSDKDSFCTGHAKEYNIIHENMISLLLALKANEFKIRRYKIEHILLDSKINEEVFKL